MCTVGEWHSFVIHLDDLLYLYRVGCHSTFADHQKTPSDNEVVIRFAARSILRAPQVLQIGEMAVYNHIMAKDVIHISEAEIIIENDARPVAVLHPAEPVRRTISECIALLPEDSTATIDPDFAKDVEEAIESHREPLNPPAWD
ncbi:MAG: hypothetical protein AUF67_04045 [Acidobacteria bacterium 13_1_20CM_58_21]|nr:MAG: hypothetical protein AUF67_04045 [Acidobacteria bacterium 13_1_20CM_58_21]